MEFGSFKFDGSSDTIYTANDYDDVNLIALPTSVNKSWTLESWIYHTSTSGLQNYFSHGTLSTTSSWQLQLNSSKIMFYWINSGWGWDYYYATPVISVNTWYHFALVFDHSIGTYGTLTAYLDGQKVNLTQQGTGSEAVGGSITDGKLALNSTAQFQSTLTDKLFIGSYFNNTAWMNGYITDARIL